MLDNKMKHISVLLLSFSLTLFGAEKLPLSSIDHGMFLRDLKNEIANPGRSTFIISTIPEYWLFTHAAKGKQDTDDYRYAEKIGRGKIVVMIFDMLNDENGVMKLMPMKKAGKAITATVIKGKIIYKLQLVDDETIEATTRSYAVAIANRLGQDGAGVPLLTFNNTLDDKVIFSGYEECELIIKYDEMEFKYKAPYSSLFKPRLLSDGSPAPASYKFDPWTGNALVP